MLRQSEPTSSTLQLVASDMTGIMEKLDTHELDLDDGEYDTADMAAPGVLSLLQLCSTPPFPACFLSRFLLCAVCSRAPALQGHLPPGGVQGARGQSLPVVSHHRQDPGGGALHLRSGPLLRHHAEEHQQGERHTTNRQADGLQTSVARARLPAFYPGAAAEAPLESMFEAASWGSTVELLPHRGVIGAQVFVTYLLVRMFQEDSGSGCSRRIPDGRMLTEHLCRLFSPCRPSTRSR